MTRRPQTPDLATLANLREGRATRGSDGEEGTVAVNDIVLLKIQIKPQDSDVVVIVLLSSCLS